LPTFMLCMRRSGPTGVLEELSGCDDTVAV